MAKLLQNAGSRNSEPQPTLLFIPDISGFTQFVNTTEINHSRHIIEELLEVLIDADTLGLEVSEIEGDAILFYRNGEAPSFEELLLQVRHMYTAFHAHLKKYENRRICQCGACSTTNNLTLKFVSHYGETAKNYIKQFTKLFGTDVIIAHRLLKNDVPEKEYLLITQSFNTNDDQAVEVAHASLKSTETSYDVGLIGYSYLNLKELRDRIPQPTPEDFELPGVTVKVLKQEAVIHAPIEMVFDVISDLSFRHQWQEGLQDSDQLSNQIAQNGSTHRCVIKGDASDPFFISHGFKKQGDTITFSDTDHKVGIGNVFTLERLEKSRTLVQVHTILQKNIIKLLFFNLFLKKKFLKSGDASWENLEEYCRQLIKNDKSHPVQILLEPFTLAEAYT